MRTINAAVMRQNNRKLILNHIRMRSISRAELAEATQLTLASITQIIDELLYEGLVTEPLWWSARSWGGAARSWSSTPTRR